MDFDRLAKLTEKQRACLRLVFNHYSSKEIARELGIGVDAVDQRVKSAMRTLGVPSRITAARMLAEHEQGAVVAAPSCHTAPLPAGEAHPPRERWLTRLRRRVLPRTRRGRFVLWACITGLFLGDLASDFSLDDYLRFQRSMLMPKRQASGDITLIAIDNPTLAKVGPLPWNRRYYAKLARELDRLGARRIAFTLHFDTRKDREGDRALAQAFEPLDHRLILSVAQTHDPIADKSSDLLPLPELRGRADLAHVQVHHVLPPLPRAVRHIEYNRRVAGRTYPSLSSLLSGVSDDVFSASFPIEYSIDPGTIPTVSAVDVLKRAAPPDKIVGKIVVVGITAMPNESAVYLAPGYGWLQGVYFLILGAETLKAGPPLQVPSFIICLMVALIIAACAIVNKRAFSIAVIGGGIFALIVLPYPLQLHWIYIDAVRPLFMLIASAVALIWVSLRQSVAKLAHGPGENQA